MVLLIGLVYYEAETVNAKANNEKVQQLLNDEYEYDLTRLLIVRKNSDKPEVVIIEDVSEEEGYVSSLQLREKNKDFSKNQDRLERLETKLIELMNDSTIEHVQPDYIYTNEVWSREDLLDTPDDFDLTPLPATGNHWYYEKSNLRSLWYEQDCSNSGTGCGGSSDVVVAVIDTGLAFQDYTSVWADIDETPYDFDPAPDMFSGGSINLWINDSGEPPEVANNDIDDDNNGFIDDYNGVNIENYFYCETYVCSTAESGETGHPDDDGGHGTFVTGLIASLTGNGSGSVSPAHNVSIMTIKANYEKSPSFGSSRLVESINYAVDNGADIINMSLAGSSYDFLLEEAINDAHDAGVLIIASSGNAGGSVYYPAKYANVVAVGAVKADDTKTFYSASGPELDLVAYVGNGSGQGDSTYQQSYTCFTAGTNCYNSTDLTRYKQFSNQYAIGTSFASPQVAAAAAIILGNNLVLSPEELRLALVAAVNDIGPVGFDNDFGHGVIDFKKADEFVNGTQDIENLTVFRHVDGDGSWIWVGNPDLVNKVYVNVSIGGITKGTYSIEPQKTLPLSYPDLFAGPVKILGSGPIHVSNKARTVNGKLHEALAIPSVDYDTRFYFPIYRNINDDGGWLWIANPSNQTTANVQITLGGQDRGTYQVLPGKSLPISFPGEFSGPLVVDSDIDVYVSLKTRTGGGLDEMPGIVQTQMSTSFYYPIYRHTDGDGAWIWLGNPSNSVVANVIIKVAGIEKGQYTIAPNSNLAVSYPGLFEGPLVINSDINIYTTLKSRTNDTINEFKGIAINEFSTSYYYPVYRSVGGDGAWLWIGNPDNVIVANITVKIAGVEMGQYTIAPNSNIAVSYPGLFDGPVSITSDMPVYSTLKSRSYDNINEFVGAND
jgi:hypothetical protein